MTDGYETLEVRREGPVGWLVFDRPGAGNALDSTVFTELERAWQELDADPSVAVIVNTANGSAFQTGVDLGAIQRDRDAMKRFSRQTRDAELAFTAWHLGVRKPVIVAVNGVCAGGGLHFVADADIVLASSDATFLDPHVTVGQATAYEGIALVRQSPMEAVVRMVLVGRHERMTAQRAFELGIVGEVVEPERLRAAAQELGETIARNSPTAMAVTKRALWRALEHGLTDACRAGARDLVSMWGHADQEEGPLAFAEKRDAVWQPLSAIAVGPPTDGSRSHIWDPQPTVPGPNRRAMTSYRDYEFLKLERHGPVGWLINNRPEQLNAMNAGMRDEFADAWLELDADPEVRVIVHTGEGRAFQTGVDVSEIASDGVGMQRYRESMENFDVHFTAWHQGVRKPVITAVNGICCGGGLHWVADADIVIAASDAQFFDPHVSIGQVVSLEAIGLIRKMPVEAVMRMAFVGRYERMNAARAYQLGMISQIVDPPERLREAAQELAENIARNSPAAMAATKHALWRALELGLTDACRAGAKDLVSMWGHPDQEEGPLAFAEKREAVWQPLDDSPSG